MRSRNSACLRAAHKHSQTFTMKFKTSLSLFDRGSLVDPQSLSTHQLLTIRNLHYAVNHHTRSGAPLSRIISAAHEMLGAMGMTVADLEVHQFVEEANGVPFLARQHKDHLFLCQTFLARRSMEDRYRQYCGPLADAAKLPTHLHLPSHFIGSLHPRPSMIFASDGPKMEKGTFWLSSDREKGWCQQPCFLPLPVTPKWQSGVPIEPSKLIRSSAITSWPFAVAVFPPQNFVPIARLVLEGDLPAVSVVISPGLFVEILFRTDANSKKEWKKAAIGIRSRLEEHGAEVLGLYYWTLAHVPNQNQHLLYCGLESIQAVALPQRNGSFGDPDLVEEPIGEEPTMQLAAA